MKEEERKRISFFDKEKRDSQAKNKDKERKKKIGRKGCDHSQCCKDEEEKTEREKEDAKVKEKEREIKGKAEEVDIRVQDKAAEDILKSKNEEERSNDENDLCA